MNTLTVQAIETIGRQINTHVFYDSTTIAYIQTLLRPYAEAIEQAQSVDFIKEWIPLALPGALSHNSLVEIEQVEDDLTAAKNAVIGYLASEIIELATNVARDNNDVTVLPWDVQRAIAADPELSTLVGIRNDIQTLRNGEPRLLPVTINGYTHYLSQDFVAGLLLFSLKYPRDYGVTMFGAPFDLNYIGGANRYTSDEPSQYTITIFEEDYDFNSPDFMQGFATGAEWAGVDHHDYWRNIIQRTENGDLVLITF